MLCGEVALASADPGFQAAAPARDALGFDAVPGRVPPGGAPRADGAPAAPAPTDHILRLVDKGSYLELPPDVFNDFTEATVEAWVKWNAFGNPYQRIFAYGGNNRDISLTTEHGTNTLWFVTADPNEGTKYAIAKNVLKAGQWMHIAGVAGGGGMRLYLNGELVATNPFTGCFKSLGADNASRLGQTVTANVDDTPFDGELAEVRVWKTARTEEQIRENLTKQLTGDEEGLAALWNFNDPANPGRDASPNHHDGKMVGNARATVPSVVAGVGLSSPPFLGTSNQVLQLDGNGSYVELPTDILDELHEVTVEGWVKWETFSTATRFFDFGNVQRQLNVSSGFNNGDLYLVVQGVPTIAEMHSPGAVPLKGWCHIAAVAGKGGMRLYLNGTLLGTKDYGGDFVGRDGNRHAFLGESVFRSQAMRGEMDEVRVWNSARTPEEIRENLTKQLTGSELGLVGLWNFDDQANPGRDASPNHHDGKLMGNARTVEVTTPGGIQAPSLFQFTGNVLQMEGDGAVETGVVIIPSAGDYTVECWAFAESIDTKDLRIIAAQDRQFYLGTTLAGKVRLGDSWNNTGVPFPYGGWHHFAFCKHGDGVSLYIDGNLAGERSGTLPPPPETGTFRIGRQWNVGEQWKGFIDDVRIWKTARTAEQIRENLTKTLKGDEPNLIGLWNFDDDTANDLSPGGHHGALSGGARIVPAASAGVSPLTTGSGVAATLSGRITDAAGRPLRGAEVRLMQSDRLAGTVKSSGSGDYFLLFALTPAPYRVVASLENLEAESAETEFVDGSNNLDLILRDTLRISGILTGPDGQPRRGVKVEAVNTAGAVEKFSVTDAKGKFILRRLPDGDYTLRAGGVALEGGKGFAVSAEVPLTDLKLTLTAAAAPEGPPLENRALALDGSGAHVNLPAGMFGNLRETTIEAWVRFDSLDGLQRFFSFGAATGQLYLGMEQGFPTNVVFGCFPPKGGQHIEARNTMEKNRWCHVAAVIDTRETQLYFNGTLAGTVPKASSFADFPAESLAWIGGWGDPNNGFTGGIDEFRVWAAARTGEEIRAAMFQRLSGREEGLAGLWNFDDPEQPGRDATRNGFDGEMVQNAAVVSESLPAGVAEIAQWATLSGATLDVDGRAKPKATVNLDRGEEHLETEVDPGGNYSFLIRASDEEARLIATDGDLSSVPASLVLGEGPHTLDLTLRDAAPLSGHVRTPDGSPISTVVIQAVPVVEAGQDTLIPGLQAEFFNEKKLDDFPVINGTAEPKLSRTDPIVDFPLLRDGIAGANSGVKTPFFARWKGRIRIMEAGEYTFYVAANDRGRLFIDGKEVVEVTSSSKGSLPLSGSENTGETHLTAGEHELLLEFYNNDGRDGLRLSWSRGDQPKDVIPAEVLFHERGPLSTLTTIADARGRFRFPKVQPGRYTLRAQVPGGFAEWEQGREVSVEPDQQQANLDFTLAPFKQGRWKTYAHQDGLPSDEVNAVFQAADGALWFGTGNGGAARFDGRQFSKLTAEDGLPPATVISAIAEDEGGRMWLATDKGLCLYDPKAAPSGMVVFTAADGLPADQVTSLAKDKAGRLWVGTGKGLCFFDPFARKASGKAFIATRKEPAVTVKDLTSGAHDGTLMGAARLVKAERPAAFPREQPMTTAKVLQLDGKDSYVELPPGVFARLPAATVEGWVKWDEYRKRSRFFDFGEPERDLFVAQWDTPGQLTYSIQSGSFAEAAWLHLPNALNPGQWNHIAAVSGPGGMRLYLNGELRGTKDYDGSFAATGSGFKAYLGRSVWGSLDTMMAGAMDEVRVWDYERSEEEIRENLGKHLTGNEPGLAALWNFDDGTARDATPNGHDGMLVGEAEIVEAERPVPVAPLLKEETVLELDGNDSYVELPSQLFKDFTAATVEFWVRPDGLTNGAHFFEFDAAGRIKLYQSAAATEGMVWFDQRVDVDAGATVNGTVNGNQALELGQWHHIAAVSGPSGMKLYLNGTLVGSDPRTETFGTSMENAKNFIAACTVNGASKLKGQMDEFRIWRTERSEEEIRANLRKQLTGSEPGLVGLWNFEKTGAGERDVPLLQDSILSLRADSGTVFGSARRKA